MDNDSFVRVLQHYDVGLFRRHKRIPHGYVSDNWWVETTTGQFFLRRRHASLRKPRQIRAQHKLIKYLRNAGFPVAEVISTRYNHTFVELESHIYELHRYINGELCDVERQMHWALAAHTLAWYHQAVAEFDHPALHRSRQRYGPKTLAGIFERIMKNWGHQVDHRLNALLSELAAHTKDLMVQFSSFGALPKLIIHGDYHAENLILRDDKVVGVVDFDHAHRCFRAMELAEALIFFATERSQRFKHIVYSGFLNLDQVRRFVEIYCATVPLTKAEIQALPHLIRTVWLCAALDPPLQPLLSIENAPQALPEILILADWAGAHADDITGIGLAAHG